MASRIGCDNLVYAIMTAEDTSTSAPVYGAVKAAPGVMSVSVNPNASQETLFADDGPMETATTLGKIDVEVKKSELTTENKADLLGHTIDGNGGLVYGDSDIPPFVALGFRALKSNGKYRYTWLYKGKFMDPEDQNETKGDGINFQADTIKGQFVKLNYPVSAGGKSVRPWKYEIDADYSGAQAAAMNTFFDSVKMPSAVAPTSAPSLTVAYAAGTASGTTKATITETAGGGNHFAYKLSAGSIAVPVVGATVSGSTAYTSAADIAVAANQYVQIYELTAANAVVKFAQHQVVVGEIKA